MLLSCCFRQPTTKKHKKNKKWGKEQLRDIEETYTLTESLISTPVLKSNNIKQAINQKTPKLEEKVKDNFHLEHNEKGEYSQVEKEKRTQYQIFPTNIIQSSSFKTQYKNQTNSKRFTNTSIIQNTHQFNPKCFNHMFAGAEDLDGSDLSVNTINNSNRDLITNTQPVKVHPTTSTNTNEEQSINECKTEKDNDDALDGEGVSEIETDDDEQLKLEKIRVKEKEINTLENEEILNTFKEEYEGKIEGLKMQHQTELQTVKQKYQEELNREKENNRKEIENAKIIAKNEANETISELNKQIVLERGKMFVEQQEQNRRLEEEYRMKEERINQTIKDNNKREQAWEDEKANIVIEVQRLKAEATKMVKILTMEYEEDNVNADKKRSLSQEVYSLQLVVEMRSGELKNLREQLARAIIQLEDASALQEELKKATARIEDLEEQLIIKSTLEKQLSLDKTYLEQNMTDTRKAMDRMTKDIETLQWRSRNKYDVPDVSICSNYHHQDKQMSTLASYFDDKQQLFTDFISTRPESTPVADKKLELKQQTTNMFRVSEEMMDATTIDTEDILSYDGPSLCFPNNVDRTKIKDCKSENEDHISDFDAEIDSLDEGVGDISSEGERVHSPVIDSKCEINNKENEKALNIPLKGQCNQLKIPLCSKVTDRIPSRLLFQ